ncbi:hypothetical protein H6F88_32155 [Oculatella sp. FACHB-28]|uniref:hypothetical protein n=1 Tax=Oculatella sp. FACHB-28 TaxID=2692845 RepID=UPI00168224D1|nr:hypothetical protein [Oculatella sp. FACHB-28]MBD2060599.1 hypothetical protein [Oculatella sp. FACHB-28]
MVLRRLVYSAIALILSGILFWRIAPSFSTEQGWRPVWEVAPPGLLEQLRQDYATEIPADVTVDVRQMQLLKLQQPESLPLYLINTRVYSLEHPDQTPTCGTGGCLFLGYIPGNNGFRQVLNGWINDFQVQGEPPVIGPVQRVLNHVPCFQLTTYNARTQRISPTQTLCFNGGRFVPAATQSLRSFN